LVVADKHNELQIFLLIPFALHHFLALLLNERFHEVRLHWFLLDHLVDGLGLAVKIDVSIDIRHVSYYYIEFQRIIVYSW